MSLEPRPWQSNAHGPWELSDFPHVTDWRLVEGELHRHFQKHNFRDVVGTRELFSAPPRGQNHGAKRSVPRF
jgi:hypothetical protein